MLLTLFSLFPAPTVSLGGDASVTISQDRRLQAVNGFKPLDCNKSMKTCESFEGTFGPGPFTSRVVIECGTCYIMDHRPQTYRFRDGLDIQGKLIIPEPTDTTGTMTLKSPLILVQGHLEVTSTKAVDGTPSVKFILTGSSAQFFTGADNNSAMCNGNCKAGIRSVTVAGGRLNSTFISMESHRDAL